MLFVGSCFADSIGSRFLEEKFRAVVNPYGTMYNPTSVWHTVKRFCEGLDDKCAGQDNAAVGLSKSRGRLVAFFTLGTNHVYRLKETGEIVDNCQKRPQRLFQEEELTVEECVDYLQQSVNILRSCYDEVHVVLTVSPIRYQKYGFHESQLSKATLLLAVNQMIKNTQSSDIHYFPAYEIVLDELRDYRFYKADMLHPSDQAVEFIWQQLVEYYLSPAARRFLQEWKPIKEALAHRPFHAESEAYQSFLAEAKAKETALLGRYGL
jgi:hypothetical protein